MTTSGPVKPGRWKRKQLRLEICALEHRTMRQIWNRSLWLKSKTIIGQLDTIMENLTETMDILGYTILYLVGGLEHLDYFSIYGMSSGTH